VDGLIALLGNLLLQILEVNPPNEINPNVPSAKTGKVAERLNIAACNLPVDQNMPAGSCNREDSKN
jgi:hypothetical protein